MTIPSVSKNTSNQNPLNEGMGKAQIIVLSILFAISITVAILMVFNHGIIHTARAQLKAIKAGETSKAYAMTSSEFQQATSLEAFTTFVKKYPILANSNGISFSERKVDGDLGYLAGTITAESGNTSTIEFQLVKEKGDWKIQGVELSDKKIATKQDASDQAMVHAILISDASDRDGFVTKEKTAIPKSARKIYATVQIVSSLSGGAVSATLVYLPKNEKTGPEIDKTTKAGNIMKSFAFNRKGKSWPKGNYEVRVELSSGNTKAIQFKVV